MPTSKSTKKRLRQSEKKRRVNQGAKAKIKTLKKKVIAAAESGDSQELDRAMKKCFSALDRAANKNMLHKRKVARDKARLSAAVKASATGS